MASGDSINFGSFWKSYCVGDKYRYYPNSFSVIALPDFNFKDQYYLLHQMESYWIDKIVNQPLLYSKIIFNESNPRGKVVEKNVPFTTKIQLPVFHLHETCQQKDWWIMHLEARSNKYLKFLLDSTASTSMIARS